MSKVIDGKYSVKKISDHFLVEVDSLVAIFHNRIEALGAICDHLQVVFDLNDFDEDDE